MIYHVSVASLTRHSAVRELKTAASELGLQPTSARLMVSLHALMYLLHGCGEKAKVDISGEDNLIEAVKASMANNKGIVVATTHDSGLDVPTAAYLTALLGGPVVINAASTNMTPFNEGVGGVNPEAAQYLMVGRENFYPIPYGWQEKGVKEPCPFSEEDYNGLVNKVGEGALAIVSAFPDHERRGGDEEWQRKIGSAAVHVALAAGVPMVPIRVESSNPEAFSSGPSLAVLKKHSLTVQIGGPVYDTVAISSAYDGANPEEKAQIRKYIKGKLGSRLEA